MGTHTRPQGFRFKLAPCDETFFEAPPFGWDFDFEVAGSCQRVFAVLTEGNLEREWFPNFVSSTWLGEAGPGVEREFCMTYMRIIEHFVEYEPGSRLRFYLTSATLPLLKRFAEEYELTALGPQRTRIRWRIGYEPHPFMAWAHPVLRPHFDKDFNTAVKRLTAYLARVADRTSAELLSASARVSHSSP